MKVGVCYLPYDSKVPNVKSSQKQRVYESCINSLFRSLRASGNDAHFFVYTDAGKIDKNNFDTEIQFIHVQYETAINSNKFDLYSSANFTLDCIKHFSTEGDDPNECMLFIDPDCIITDKIDEIEYITKEIGLSVLEIDYPLDHLAHMCSRRDLREIYNDAWPNEKTLTFPKFIGGEFISIRRDVAIKLMKDLDNVLNVNLKLCTEGRAYCATEEPIMTLLVHHFMDNGGKYYAANDGFCMRIHTARRWRKYNKQVLDTIIWHLPEEKERHLPMLFEKIDNTSKIGKNQLAKKAGISSDYIRELIFITYSFIKRFRDIIGGKIADY